MALCHSRRRWTTVWQRRLYSADSRQHGRRDYDAAVQALNGLQSNFSIVEAIRKLGPNSNKQALPDMISWVRRVGYEPSDFDALRPIHIAGTKGKGSTSSFISSILAEYLPKRQNGAASRQPSSVGLYTSPHLRFVRERIKINNEPISEELFAKCFWEVWDRLESSETPSSDSPSRAVQGKPVYFHYLTLMALHCYMQERIGTAVIECGIGGEYDTTNILCTPSVTGVTSLGIDHEALLGNTLEQIAWHKAGIFKRDVPAFTAPQADSALTVLHERAQEKGTRLHVVPLHGEVSALRLGLQGHFQKFNASLAIAVSAMHLQQLGYSDIPDPFNPFAKLPPQFVRALEETRLGGRCDLRFDQKRPGLSWYIDGGHTLESIEVAARWFAAHSSAHSQRNATRVLIFNQQTRDATMLARRLFDTLAAAMNDNHPFTHAIFCPNTTYKAAGYKSDLVSINTSQDDVDTLRVQKALAQTWKKINPNADATVVGTIEEAIERARAIAGDDERDVLVTGSLHLVGGCIEVLESEQEAR